MATTVRDLRFLPYSQANKSDCHRLWLLVETQISGSETKAGLLLRASVGASVSSFSSVVPHARRAM